MSTAEYFGLSVQDPVLIDPICFQSWVNGLTAERAAHNRAREWSAAAATTATAGASAAAPGADYAFLLDLLRRDTLDQYRALAVMEHHLKNPQHLAAQALSPLPP